MDKISNSWPVKSIIVRAKDRYQLSLANDNFLYDRKQIPWDSSKGVVTDQSGVMISCRVEVTNWYDFPLRVAMGHRFQKHFKAEFGLAVGADWSAVELLGAVILLTVNGSWRGEEKLFTDFVFFHHFEEIHRPDKVVFVVGKGLVDGFRGWLFGSEVEDGGDGSVEVDFLLEDGVQERQIEDIALIEVDSLLVGGDVLSFREIMRNGFKNPAKVVKGGIEVVIADGDVVGSRE